MLITCKECGWQVSDKAISCHTAVYKFVQKEQDRLEKRPR